MWHLIMFSPKLLFRENGDLCGSGTKTLAISENKDYIWILQHRDLLSLEEP